ncbi:ABC transporter substrate-binding protein [Eubacteriales bacterium mix99]|jgi:putative ABC transport system substrate-binding protein|nr:ABC transporter substrate-binding protein [Clostridiales bacterium]
MKRMKRISAMLSALGLLLTAASGCTEKGAAAGKYTVGIAQFAEHGSLDNCREGFLAGLAKEGFTEGKNLRVRYENAQADGGTANQIADSIVAGRADLIAAIGTPMAQSAFRAAGKADTPVIYTAVNDPVAAELAREDGTPTGNVTGTSDRLPVEQQLEMIRTILPDAKKIGILYSTSEVNSISTVQEYRDAAPAYDFKIVESGISVSADIPLAADQLLTKVDCLCNLTDNTVVSSLPLILEKAGRKGIPVFGSEIEQVKIGCLAAVGLDYYELGIQTGKMAGKVLKGEARAEEIPFKVCKEASFYGNTAVAKNLGISIPEELTGTAGEMFDRIAEHQGES